MRIGIFSDVHGNIAALKAVIASLEQDKVDKLIILGDLIGGGPFSEEVVNYVRNLKIDKYIVRGNRESYIKHGMPKVVHDDKKQVTDVQIQRFEWQKSILSDSTKDFICALHKHLPIELEGHNIYISHYPIDENGNYRAHVKKATIEDNLKMFEGIDADIYLYGHTHVSVFNELPNKLFINPGAVGCPKGVDAAPYGILTLTKDSMSYEQKYATYDIQKVIEEIKEINFPGYEEVLNLFYI